MLEFKEFKAGHLKFVTPQDNQKDDWLVLIKPEYQDMLNEGIGVSGWVGNRCIGGAGILHVHGDRWVAWAMMCHDIGRYKIGVVRRVHRFLKERPEKRIEMSVVADFEAGHRFARAIGMRLETPEPLKYYGANGEDEMLYSVVK